MKEEGGPPDRLDEDADRALRVEDVLENEVGAPEDDDADERGEREETGVA
ncbi:hypothetical protein [Actinomyces culturomici]|nr:hypothetical protein [Actinomyces culturomici]